MNQETKQSTTAKVVSRNGVVLSNRMVEILDLLVQGKSNGEIAAACDVTAHTVKVHMWRLFTRIEVGSRGEAAAWWLRNNPGTETPEAAYARGVADGQRMFIERLERMAGAMPTTPA